MLITKIFDKDHKVLFSGLQALINKKRKTLKFTEKHLLILTEDFGV